MAVSGRRHPGDEEHRLQVACVEWFRMQHSDLCHALFAVPNGARRDKVTGARLKREGVLAGVSDLILLVPNAHYGALLLELKTPKGRQSESQKAWARDIQRTGNYRYVIVRSVEQFKAAIDVYLNDKANDPLRAILENSRL